MDKNGNVGKKEGSKSRRFPMVRHELYADGYVYEGGWKEGKREGQGKLISANGQVWEGEFRDNKIYSGIGTLVCSNGVYEGKWVHGMLRKGKLTQNDGSFLEGRFSNGNFYNGIGVFVNHDGTKLQGTWVMFKRVG
ncbi:MAG: hypothetical protein WBJ21_02060, partial [Burkholderiaceae bacterium]